MDDIPLLTRALIESGGIDAMVARDAPGLRVLTEEQRAASLHATLAARPPGDAWLFGYGSLIWNPMIHSVEQRPARVEGWHRAFCLTVRAGRGSAANPGLMLGLDAGGSCRGVAFRIAEDILEAELTLLWRREMLGGAYVPRWLDLLDERGARFGGGIAFTVNPHGDHYAGTLARDAIIRSLATASGALGSAADYLFRTVDGLARYGIPDAELELLAGQVRAIRE